MTNRMLICLLVSAGLISCTAKLKTGNDRSLKRVIDSAFASAEKQSLLMAGKYSDQDGRLPRTYENNKDVSSDSRYLKQTRRSEVDVPLTYADYYYLEALSRLKKKI